MRGREKLRHDLWAIAEPRVAEVQEHPFWAGLREGTLAPAALWYFAQQDARFTVPTYARSLARTAALAVRDEDSALLCSAASATLDAVFRMDGELTALARELGEQVRPVEVSPATHAHTAFMLAAPAASFAAAIGGLLPMTWFHQKLSLDLRRRCRPGSRYRDWIDQYCPESGFHDYVEAYLGMVDAFGEQCSDAERSVLTEYFVLGARHESAFAESAWRLRDWPVLSA